MAPFDPTRAAYRNGPLADAISRLAYTAVSSAIGWNDTRKTRRALSQLSAHELNDIGLCRGDIEMMRRR